MTISNPDIVAEPRRKPLYFIARIQKQRFISSFGLLGSAQT